MNEQELIIQGNQASVLMPELKRYIDAQIAALAERDKDTLFINFSEVSSPASQIILFVDDGDTEMTVYTDVDIPEDDEFPPEGGYKRSIAQSIYAKYHESYPWLEENSIAKKVVDGYIVLVPTHSSAGALLEEDTPWLRLGYCAYSNETDVIEQHLGLIKEVIGDDSEGEDLFSEHGFLTSRNLPIEADVSLSAGRNFVLKGWMLLKNS